MFPFSVRAFACACLLVLASAVNAADSKTYRLGDLAIETPWTREAPDGARVAGGYLRITNTGKTADRLVGGTAAFAKRFEVHEMAMEAGVMRMRELAQGIEIKPGQTVELKPGGLHVMFMEVTAAPKAGTSAKSMLKFEKAGTIEVDFAVVPRGSNAPAAGGHKHH